MTEDFLYTQHNNTYLQAYLQTQKTWFIKNAKLSALDLLNAGIFFLTSHIS
jgi:hypothetical protein